MAYYNTGSPGMAGTMYGTNRVTDDAFKGNDLFGRDYYDTTNEGRAGYQRFAETLGGDSKFQNYVQSKYPQMWNSFAAASGDDTTLTWTKFLEGSQDRLAQDWSNMSNTERGYQPGRTLGKLRWL